MRGPILVPVLIACSILPARGQQRPLKADSLEFRRRHMVMDRHDVYAIRPEGLQDGSHFLGQHRNIAGDDGVGIAAVEGRPHGFSPMRALIVAPISFTVKSDRPMVIL
jgi:hypothetical protein